MPFQLRNRWYFDPLTRNLVVSFALLLVVGGAIAITVTGGGAKSAARKGEGIDLEKPSSTQPSSSPSSDSTDAPLETEMTSEFDTTTSGEEETTTNTETVEIDISTESVLRRLVDEATTLNPSDFDTTSTVLDESLALRLRHKYR